MTLLSQPSSRRLKILLTLAFGILVFTMWPIMVGSDMFLKAELARVAEYNALFASPSTTENRLLARAEQMAITPASTRRHVSVTRAALQKHIKPIDSDPSSQIGTEQANVMRSLLSDSYAQSSEDWLQHTRRMLQMLSHSAMSMTDLAGRKMDQIKTPFAWGTLRTPSRTARGSNVIVNTSYVLHRGCAAQNASLTGRPRLRVMVVCGMHAREPFTSDLCRTWMLYSATSTGKIKKRFASAPTNATSRKTAEEPALTDECLLATGLSKRVAPIDWLYVPVANQGGRDLVAQAKRHLKSTGLETSPLCHRTNARGVDLNRNWPDPEKALAGKDNDHPPMDTHMEVNPGPNPFSEPETEHLNTLLHNFQPHVLLAIHSGAYAILTPYDDSFERPKDFDAIIKVANWMGALSTCKSQNNCTIQQGSRGLYPMYGSMGDYAYRNGLATLPFTLEVYQGGPSLLRTEQKPGKCFSFFNPPSETLDYHLQVWNGLWRGWYYMTERDQAYLHRILLEIEARD